MTRSSGISRLLDKLRRPPHDFRPSTEVFAELDVTRLAAEMNLEAVGRERGQRNDPATNSTVPDEVEVRIIERIEAEKKRAHGLLEDENRAYAERLSGLSFEEMLGSIREAAPSCVGEFRALVAKGLDELHGLRRALTEHEAGREDFRKRNGLVRPPQLRSPASRFFKVALLLFILAFEVVVNGSFLAKGSAQGLLGGVTEAVGFAILNVGWSVLVAMFGAIQINHRSGFRKLIGAISFVLYLVPAVLLNLALAHYREVSGSLVETAGADVIRRLTMDPFGLAEIQSWIFFAIGLFFSLVAFIDALLLSDPYPGYEAIERRLIAARDNYMVRRQELIDELLATRDDYRNQIAEINDQLAARRTEYDLILFGLSRLSQLFVQHQDHLERSGGVLFSAYRDANVAARSTPAPKRFKALFKLDRIAPQIAAPQLDRAEIVKTIRDSQELMAVQSGQLHQEFERAIEKYRQLDDLVPEVRDVAAAA